MANVEKLVPFILYMEAGLKKKYLDLPYEQMFEQAKKTGYSNDPNDRGGLTMCGVTFTTYTTYCKRIGKTATEKGLINISYADWKAILKVLFWDRWKADQIENQALANLVVDWVWASGTHGIKRPQRILGVSADGIVGQKTLAAMNNADAKTLFDQLHADRLKHFDEIVAKSPSQKVYLKGWYRRVNAITFDGFDWI